MNVLFLTLCEYESIYDKDLYTDLLRVFMRDGHSVYLVSPIERRKNQKTNLVIESNSTILRLRIGNIQKTNIIEKGISTITLESIFIQGIKRYFSDIAFDLILYSTPPITLVGAVEYIKKRDNAKTFLLLKDIFPQNAVDIGLLSTKGVKGFLYRYFRKKEKKLYSLSDTIGCMSPANVEYVIRENPYINPQKVIVSPNCIEVIDKSVNSKTRNEIREKYNIPLNKVVFIYGGNLGKPQGIPFMIKCIYAARDINNAYFLIVGDGTEYNRINNFIESERQTNVKLLKRLPKNDYDTMVSACDVGLIFLDHRFSIPNFPSRIVSYMQSKKPVLACTDSNTDIGTVITHGEFGWWCESSSTEEFCKRIYEAINSDLLSMGERAFQFLNENWNVNRQYRDILGSLNLISF